MSLFDSILGQVTNNPTVTNMAEKFGIDPQLAAQAVAALGAGHQDERDTIEVAAEKTGMDADMLGQIRDAIGGEGSLGKFAAMIDQDGDGNPLDELTDIASGLFGRK
ncbi:hypothetical protein [Qipengyuania sp. ASV99]|uniref:hypothetical protein n=1 Tax=Qipengyuania sp. ASV99 TaxID=3399681 RepID=UPI003A4C6222